MAAITQNEHGWHVAGDIDMGNANVLLDLSKALTLADSTVVDFSQVIEVDTSAVSLMLEWQRRAVSESKQIAFVNLPKGLESLTDLYGVTDLIR